MSIYVLELENGKYYVGYIERKQEEKIDEYVTEEKNEWIKIHNPVRVLYNVSGTKSDVNELTLKLMREKGYDNVRGGKWSLVKLHFPPKQLYQNKMQNFGRLFCNRCGRNNHVSETCYATTYNDHSEGRIYNKRNISKTQFYTLSVHG